MAQPGWINANENRYFPFQKGEGFFPRTAIVDFNCSVGHNAVFNCEQDTVWLSRIHRTGGEFHFYFSSDAEGIANNPLVFEVPITDHYSTMYKELLTTGDSYASSPWDISSASEILDCVEDSLWEGYLVVGDLTELIAEIADETVVDGIALIETCLVHNLFQGYARSLNLANKSRTRWEPDTSCDCEAYRIFTEDANTHDIYDTCIDGAIKLEEGYNCSISQNEHDNSLTISASVGAGAGECCEEVKTHPLEVAPEGSDYYDGSLGCNDVLRSINGIGGRLLDITSGVGVSVSYLPAQHTIRLDVNLVGLNVCGVDGYSVGPADDPEITPCEC